MSEYTLYSEYLPARTATRQEIVLLHGWGSSRRIWYSLLPYLREWAGLTLIDLPGCGESAMETPAGDISALARAVLQRAPHAAVYLGWSLGGQVAAKIASETPERVKALVTIASNPCFTERASWPGMDSAEFARFRQALRRNSATALKRFDRLMTQGGEHRGAYCADLSRARVACDAGALAGGLELLFEADLRGELKNLAVPQLHLFSASDALVPAAVPGAMAELLGSAPQAIVETLDCKTHVPHLERPDLVAERLQSFLEKHSLLRKTPLAVPRIAKRDVADSFSRAAARYDSVATLQRRVGESLLQRLPEDNGVFADVMDLGCGTGWFRHALQQRYTGAVYLGLDLAPGMVDYARRHHPGPRGCWLVADAENLPLPAHSLDIVYSNLALQWCERPELAFAEISRVLRRGGRCCFSTLGPETLRELRAAWARVDASDHVNEFLPVSALQEAAERIPGVQLHLEEETLVVEYQRVRELLDELKTLGAHNMNRGRGRGMTGRRMLQGMLEAYEEQRHNGCLPATWQVIYGVLE